MATNMKSDDEEATMNGEDDDNRATHSPRNPETPPSPPPSHRWWKQKRTWFIVGIGLLVAATVVAITVPLVLRARRNSLCSMKRLDDTALHKINVDELQEYGLSIDSSNASHRIVVGDKRAKVYLYEWNAEQQQYQIEQLVNRTGDEQIWFGTYVTMDDSGDAFAYSEFVSDHCHASGVSVHWNNMTQFLRLNYTSGSCFEVYGLQLSGDGETLAVVSYDLTLDFDQEKRHHFVSYYNYNESHDGWTTEGPSLNVTDLHHISFLEGNALSISSSGNRTVVSGSLTWDDGFCNVQDIRFRAFEYDENADTWDQLGDDIEERGDLSHAPVSMSSDGSRFAYGVPGFHRTGCTLDEGEINSVVQGFEGKVVVVEYVEGHGWVRVGRELVATKLWERFGYSVSLSGDGRRLTVGAPHNIDSTGYVQVFEFNEQQDTWEPMTAKSFGEDPADPLGATVDMDPSGNYVVAGHDYGFDAGDVHVYEVCNSS